MMAVGPTGVGKSSLLNALLCPAVWSTEFEDCHFRTDSGCGPRGIQQQVGPWLGDTEASVMVKVVDTPGLANSGGLSDTDTLKAIIDVIKSESVQALLLVIKAKNSTFFSQNIQKQLRILGYIFGPQLWDHVITVFTWWGFSLHDVRERIRTCIKERKSLFRGNIRRTKDFCKQLDFENEKVEEITEGFENYLGVTKRFPFAFSHPVFDYEDENERRIFFENAMAIYNNAQTMSPLHCDDQCERRLRDWKRLRVLGPEFVRLA